MYHNKNMSWQNMHLLFVHVLTERYSQDGKWELSCDKNSSSTSGRGMGGCIESVHLIPPPIRVTLWLHCLVMIILGRHLNWGGMEEMFTLTITTLDTLHQFTDFLIIVHFFNTPDHLRSFPLSVFLADPGQKVSLVHFSLFCMWAVLTDVAWTARTTLPFFFLHVKSTPSLTCTARKKIVERWLRFCRYFIHYV